jgi:chromosome segregation ATPase
MKKSSVLTVIVAAAVVMLSISAYADDPSAQMKALEQRAEMIKGQMTEAKQQCGANLSGQMKSLTSSIENLVKQRVQLGAQIAQLESQVEQLKSNAVASCGKRIKQYEDEMASIKQQLASMKAKNVEAAPKADLKTKIAPLQSGRKLPPRAH